MPTDDKKLFFGWDVASVEWGGKNFWPRSRKEKAGIEPISKSPFDIVGFDIVGNDKDPSPLNFGPVEPGPKNFGPTPHKGDDNVDPMVIPPFDIDGIVGKKPDFSFPDKPKRKR